MRQTEPISTEKLLALEITEEMTEGQAEWLISISRFAEYEDGEKIMEAGDEVNDAFLILEGNVEVTASIGGST